MECLWRSLHYPQPFSPLTFHSASMLWTSFLPSASPHSFPAPRATQLRESPSLKPHPKPYCTLTATVPTTVAHTGTSSAPLKKVLVPIAHGTEEMEAVIMVAVLRRAGADVTVASVEPQLEVKTSGGIKLVADTSITSCCNEVFDLIALPGGMPGSARLRDCEVLQKMTSKQAEEKRLYGAISAAPAVTLLPWGLLRRKKITCHPAFTDKLSRFWAVKSNIQVSGELTTSRGPGTSFDFVLSLVQQLFGESAFKEVRDLLLLNASEDHSIKEETNKVEWAVDHIPRVLIPVANGSEEIEVVTIVDILRRAKAYVTIASVEKSLHILASQGTKIIADMSIGMAAESTYDLIILPGEVAGFERLNKSKVLKKLLKDQESAGRIYGAICFSPALMQRNEEKKAMGQTSVINMLKSKMVDSARIVIDGRVITSGGVATVTDFALAIVSKLFGHARARSVAEGLVFEYSRS